MFSNYLFVFVLAAMWGIAFVFPTKKLKKNGKRLHQMVKMSVVWWVLGMTYYLLGFLIPSILVPRFIDQLLSFTVALPCRLGVGVETVRTSALGLRFDLAWAMLWGLPFAFLCSALSIAVQVATKRQVTSQRRSFRG